ncbi:MAG: DUF2202 domain-containing protein [Salinibacterium sp.]|nr:DUF2202 domain-containing protein [Salinibacterium sp.]
MNKRTAVVAGVLTAGILIGGVAVAVTGLNRSSSDTTPPIASTPTSASEAPASSSTVEPHDTTASLLYIIEEEKLAHDVYVTLNATWGSSIFANILESETTHQDLMLPLLEARGIADPRSSEIGVFTDPELQTLYNELVTRGNISLDEAIQVGILIEEKDIVDLNESIAAEDEADVISVYQRLLAGSENHLASFRNKA